MDRIYTAIDIFISMTNSKSPHGGCQWVLSDGFTGGLQSWNSQGWSSVAAWWSEFLKVDDDRMNSQVLVIEIARVEVQEAYDHRKFRRVSEFLRLWYMFRRFMRFAGWILKFRCSVCRMGSCNVQGSGGLHRNFRGLQVFCMAWRMSRLGDISPNGSVREIVAALISLEL